MTKSRKAAISLATLVLALALLAIFWCDLTKSSAIRGEPLPEIGDGVQIMTWNLQWFPGHTSKQASAAAQAKHVKAVAEVIREADADIMCLQEIRGAAGLNALLAELPGYWMQVISTFRGSQQVAIISKTNARSTSEHEFEKSEQTLPRGFALAVSLAAVAGGVYWLKRDTPPSSPGTR